MTSVLITRDQAVPAPPARQAYVIPPASPALEAFGEEMYRRRCQLAGMRVPASTVTPARDRDEQLPRDQARQP